MSFNLNVKRIIELVALRLGGVLLFCAIGCSQALTEQDRKRNRDMLLTVKEQVAKSYFDKNFKGIDLNAKYAEAELNLKAANNYTEGFMAISNFLDALDDSHTSFNPPSRRTKYQHGWLMQMVGDKCYVSQVMPGSDAEKKGLKPGDRIVEIEGMRPTLAIFRRLRHLLYVLNPLPDFNLLVETPNGEQKNLKVDAKRREGQAITDINDYNTYMRMVREAENQARIEAHRLMSFGDVTVWRMPQFDLQAYQVDDVMAKVKKTGSLIIDLRGNAGGAEETLLRLIGHMFEEDLRLGEIVRRDETKPLVAKSVGDRGFRGKLVVLIDNGSASSSEVFSRVIQLHKRGSIIGDRSAGKVMRSMYYPKKFGLDVVVYYGVSVTDANLVMTDGQSLEKIGVAPDTLLLPTSLEMREKADPVLAKALAIVGVEVTPSKAGTLFPFVWK
jgi:C-terminal processing protease CtpA/Prc